MSEPQVPAPERGTGRSGVIILAAGCVGMVLLLMGFAALVAFAPWLASRPRPVDKAVTPGTRPGLQRFVNTPEALGRQAREHFVPFSFEFPRAWYIGSGGDSFVLARLESRHGTGRNQYTKLHESFAASWYTGDVLPLPGAVRLLMAELRRLEFFDVVREGPVRLAGQDAYELLIESHERDQGSAAPNRLGRLIVFPPVGRDGLVVFLEAGPAAGIVDAESVGTKGELAAVMASLVVGPAPPRP